MDKTNLFNCLVAWIDTFHLVEKCENVNDVKNGIIIAECLNYIDGNYFSNEWLNSIKNGINNIENEIFISFVSRANYFFISKSKQIELYLMRNLLIIFYQMRPVGIKKFNIGLFIFSQPVKVKFFNALDNEEFVTKVVNMLNSLNLRIIHKKLLEYYLEVLNTEIKDLNIDSNSVDSDDEGMLIDFLIHILQLVLGCAVNCKRKNEFIQVIMEMNENLQHAIKIIIQDLMSKNKTLNSISQNSYLNMNEDLNNQLKGSLNEINRLNELKNDIEQKCKTLDRQVCELQEEKMAMIFEIEKLKDKLQREDLIQNDHNNDYNINLSLQQSLKSLREDLFRLESEKEKFRLLFEESKFENENLMSRCVKFEQISKENQNLRDEIDILRHNCEKVEKLESSIENYKIKLEDMSDLRQQIRCLEEANRS
ncbi:Hook [Brachionus plicatilis]|uniref:Hook n=1 Tax=Brachionus plicatilis TaxID=10195 RepID=A0A3M7PV04_BRAPC|nr:Hook [Brachionus plicatilis]